MDCHDSIVTTACDTVFGLLGKYDRGMVYRFELSGDGEIIHEIKKEGSDLKSSYLGMLFPQSDIPLPARQLYIRNGLRYIANVDAEDVPIIDNMEGNMNLSHCRLRACAKPCIMYMRNMGVKASMSIAIVVDNQLWGLLAFHSYNEPFKPSLHQRVACETVTVGLD